MRLATFDATSLSKSEHVEVKTPKLGLSPGERFRVLAMVIETALEGVGEKVKVHVTMLRSGCAMEIVKEVHEVPPGSPGGGKE